MDPRITGAVITAVASLIIAVVSAVLTWRNRERVHEFQRKLQEEGLLLETKSADELAAKKARRDYEYDARKRLYEQCEPPLFQAGEMAENVMYRVISLAQSARRGDIKPDGTGWLADPDYYFQSTAYLLMAPLTAVKILQRRLTAVDLSLEPRLQVQYSLLKATYLTLASDFVLANRAPALSYDPDRADPGEPDRERLLAEEPKKYRRQGFYFGTLDMLVEGMLDAKGRRSKSFGEFVEGWNDPTSRINAMVGDITDLIGGFHPATCPVLWRVLVAQYLQYDFFVRLQHHHGDVPPPVEMPDDDVLAEFDWRLPGSDVADDEVRQPFEVGCAHLRSVVTRTQDKLIQR